MTDPTQPQPVERELKLQLDPQGIERLKSRDPLTAVVSSVINIDNEYFDTSDHLLHRHKMALRLRRIDGRWLQTLKTAGAGAGTLSQRGEWEGPAKTAADGGGRLDLRRLRESPLASLLAQQKARPRLVRQFRTHVQRTLWVIEWEQAQIEVALDVGEIRARARSSQSAGDLTEPICEVEVELKRGDAAAVVEFAIELLEGDGKHALPLLPLVRSKAERGYQLAAGRPADAVKASAKGFTDRLRPKMPLAVALRAVMGHGLSVVVSNCELLLRDDDAEYVHQSRVALRRVRSAIRLFDRARHDVPGSLVDELRWFAAALGAARDWDVMTDQTLPQLAKAGADVITDALRARAERRRDDERAKLREILRSRRYAALVLNGERWTMSAAPADSELLDDAASVKLQRAAKKMFKSARFFTALSPKRRHRVRINAKRLRYAMDLFAVGLPKRSTARYIEALSQLQDILGELNDAAVATSTLHQLSRSERVQRVARAAFAEIEQRRLLDAEKSLLALSRLSVPGSRA